jgi:SAM-dependent methyltransferase
MKEETAAFYDAAFRRSVGYRRDHRSALWAPLWAFAANAVRNGDRVLDIGCGPGHFAAELAQRKRLRRITYLGVDFSRVALAQAAERVPSAVFRHAVLPAAMADLVAEFRPTLVVACEFLEHVKADLRILRAVPPPTRVVLTLPLRGGRGHVRFFPTERSVRRRYGGLLTFRYLRRMPTRHFGAIGRRKRPSG